MSRHSKSKRSSTTTPTTTSKTKEAETSRSRLLPTFPAMPFNTPSMQSLFRWPSFFDELATLGHSFSESKSGLSVSEDKKNYYVEAALPGLTSNDIDVTIDQGTLWIRGSKKQEKDDQEKQYYYRSSSAFSYRVALPTSIDIQHEPSATYKDGIMTITFKKIATTPTKKIAVKTS